MTNETRRRLLDVLISCRAIGRYTAELDFAAYERDTMVRDAVERRLGIIGEALNRAADREPTLVDCLPELRQIVGLRHRVIHGYDAVDDEIVWDVVQHKLPLLQASVEALLEEVEPR
ncbi:MAG: hypothetical protein K0Q71_4536 [Thermomicrobiales bacterium]|jgi:uncharacterized protein with HEPN domain|nr:hypothetical protein [Thermomicrobiales bacterium]